MIDRIRQLAKEYDELNKKMQEPDVLSNPKEIARLGKRMSDLEPLLGLIRRYDDAEQAIAFAKETHDDPDMKAMADEEAAAARQQLPQLEQQMKSFLLPRDPDDDRSVI